MTSKPDTAYVVIALAFFASAVFWNTRNGFSDYILSAEVQRFAPLAMAFADAHDPNDAGWPELANNNEAFGVFVRSVLPKPPRHVPKVIGNDGVARRDPVGLQNRLALHDANDLYIAGAKMNGRSRGRHPIVTKDQNGKETVAGYIVLAKPAQDPRSLDMLFKQEQIWVFSLAAIIAMVLASLSTYLLTRQFVSPINDLLKAAQNLSDRKLDTRLAVDRYDEMGELQMQFNKLAETLEINERAEREWISDTSHELQTPLAILRAEIEALEDGVRQPDKSTLASLHGSVIRLSSLVKDISTLAQAREGAFGGNLSDEDLSLIVRVTAESAHRLISESGLSLELDIEPCVIVHCDRLRISQLIDNLLSNSIRYTDVGGKIRLRVFRKRNRVLIHCEDTLPCPTDDSIGKMFGRFFRNDKSRSRKSGGSGLGLPICKAIVSAHRGHIYAERSELGGLKVVIAMPIQSLGEQV